MSQFLYHKRSSVVSNGMPKLPSASALSIGEIAINFAEGYETLSIKNNNNGIASFSSDNINDKKYIASGAVVSAISALTVALEEDEYTIGQTFNDHNQRLTTLEELSIPDSTSDLTNDSGFITSANAKTQIESYHYISGYTETDPTVPAWAKAESKPTYTASEVGALATGTTLDNIADGSTRKLSGYFDDAEYDSNTKRINFKNGGTVKDYIDATDFIKDGMVSSVTVSNGNLVLTFNTDAGREDITLALTQIFNPSNYYDKTAADAKFLSGYTETDPTVPAWAKESTKPSYTASEVGAMATSERNNYLPTGTTLDSVADGTTRKLSNYSLTSHTHSNYSLTSHTHTAAEVGALPDTTDIPTQASIANSGFTKNTGTLTGVTINGSAATVSNGNASLTIELGGGSGSGLPAVTAADNGKILQVVDGQWQLVTPTVVYTGSDAPSNTLGNNGDIYLQTS